MISAQARSTFVAGKTGAHSFGSWSGGMLDHALAAPPACPAPSDLQGPGNSGKTRANRRLAITVYIGKWLRHAGMKKIAMLIAKPMLHRIERSVGRLPR